MALCALTQSKTARSLAARAQTFPESRRTWPLLVTQQLHARGAPLEAVIGRAYKACTAQLWWQPRRSLPQNTPYNIVQHIQGKVAQPLQQALARAASPVAVTGTHPCCGQYPWRGRSNALPCMPFDLPSLEGH